MNGQPAGALVVLEDAGYISAEAADVWRQSFWRIAAFVVLIVGVTFLMVRWFLMRPITRLAERLRRLRMGHADDDSAESHDLSLFTPLAREVETITESLIEARAAAAAEARLREAGENLWTAERLTVHVREQARLEPHLRRLQSRALHAREEGQGNGLRRSPQRPGHRHRAHAAGVRRRVGGARQRQ